MSEAETEPDDVGSFDEMVTLASERASVDGGVVVVHRAGCDYPHGQCLCLPKILRPYEPVEEADVAPN